jgi:hypothetical protein
VPSISKEYLNSMADGMDCNNEKLVVYIHDEVKEVRIDEDFIDLPLPSFKDLLNKLVTPFSILNNSQNYIYNPNEK